MFIVTKIIILSQTYQKEEFLKLFVKRQWKRLRIALIESTTKVINM